MGNLLHVNSTPALRISAHFRDDPSRRSKAAKILTALQDTIGSKLSNAVCLDVGCSSGTIASILSQHVRCVVGIDIDHSAVQAAGANQTTGNQDFIIGDGTTLPLPSASFDVVICAQVYEHTKNPQGLAEEIWRVLLPGGVCFFSGPNRLAVMEEHYWLPFLSWLPQPLADGYIRLFRKSNHYDIKPLFYWQLRRLWGRFQHQDLSIRMIQSPARYASEQALGKWAWLGELPPALLNNLVVWLPNYNWILKKPE